MAWHSTAGLDRGRPAASRAEDSKDPGLPVGASASKVPRQVLVQQLVLEQRTDINLESQVLALVLVPWCGLVVPEQVWRPSSQAKASTLLSSAVCRLITYLLKVHTSA